jgi:hypothetical protein
VWAAYSLSRSFNESPKLNGGEEYYALDDHLHELKIAGKFTVGSGTCQPAGFMDPQNPGTKFF